MNELGREVVLVHMSDIDSATLRQVVAQQAALFHTRDVSEAALMLEAHAHCRSDASYHSMVGRVLSRDRGFLRISLLPDRPSKDRGALWSNADSL